MKDWLGYAGLPVVAAGLLLKDHSIIGSGLSFLVVWQAVSVRSRLPLRRAVRIRR
jgi:hypothetical protein